MGTRCGSRMHFRRCTSGSHALATSFTWIYTSLACCELERRALFRSIPRRENIHGTSGPFIIPKALSFRNHTFVFSVLAIFFFQKFINPRVAYCEVWAPKNMPTWSREIASMLGNAGKLDPSLPSSFPWVATRRFSPRRHPESYYSGKPIKLSLSLSLFRSLHSSLSPKPFSDPINFPESRLFESPFIAVTRNAAGAISAPEMIDFLIAG